MLGATCKLAVRSADGRRVAGVPLLAALFAAAAAAWAMVALVVAPLVLPVLADASLLSRALVALRGTVRDGVLVLLGASVVYLALRALRPSRIGEWMEPATAQSLGAIRIVVAAILLGSTLWEDLPSSAALPRGMLGRAMWNVELLLALPIGFDAFLASREALAAYQVLTALLLALAMVGAWTRFTVPAGALAYLLMASIFRSYSWGYHTGVVPLYALTVLSFTPCGDALSFDRWRRARRGERLPSTREPQLRYGVGRYLVWMAIAIPYTLAGLSKLRNTGMSWWHGEHMKQMLVSTIVEPMHFDFQLTFHLLRGPDWIFSLLGLSALVAEVFFALVLVSRLARLVLPALTAGMHVGILLTQNILFPDLVVIQAVFYDWRAIADRVVAWFARRAPGHRAARAPAPRPIPVDSQARRQALVTSAFLATAFLVWATRTERFPLTAMQMFSRPSPLAPVQYVRPLVEYEDGTREAARFERWIGAVADSRYRWLIRDWDRHPERIELLREFLDAVAREANASLPPGRRIRRFILERRRWDFRSEPASSERGEVDRVIVHDPAGVASSRAQAGEVAGAPRAGGGA